MAHVAYNKGKDKFLKAAINLVTDDIRVVLMTSSYTPNIDTQEFLSDISANEISATGYTANGQSLTGKSQTINTSIDKVVFDCDNPQWTITGTATARYAVFIKWTGSAATSPLISYEDFGQNESITDAVYTLNIGSNGLIRL